MEFIGYSSCCKWLYCLAVGGGGWLVRRAVALGCRLDARSWSICNIVVTHCDDLGTSVGDGTVAGWVVSECGECGGNGRVSIAPIGALCHQHHYDGVDGLGIRSCPSWIPMRCITTTHCPNTCGCGTAYWVASWYPMVHVP